LYKKLKKIQINGNKYSRDAPGSKLIPSRISFFYLKKSPSFHPEYPDKQRAFIPRLFVPNKWNT
jgi:hypothetical protein